MKYILIFQLLIAFNSFAAIQSWDAVEEGQNYKLSQNIEIQTQDGAYNIKKGSRLKLIEKSEINMIKVSLHKYKLRDCDNRSMETELELIPVEQNIDEKVSVGVTLVKNCMIEVFVESKDTQTKTFLL